MERFEAKLDRSTACWIWTGNADSDGYGRMWFPSGDRLRLRYVGQIAWELYKGPIPKGQTTLRICAWKRCCNPDHHVLATKEEAWKGRAKIVEEAPRRKSREGISFVDFWRRWGPEEMWSTETERRIRALGRDPVRVLHPAVKTPRETSPLDLFQEALRDHPWRLVVTCVLANLARGSTAIVVSDRLHREFPGPRELSLATREILAPLIRDLGMQNRRAATLIRLAKAWIALGEDRPSVGILQGLPGIGPYAADSYRIFVEGRIDADSPLSGDKRLESYCRWARTGSLPLGEAVPKVPAAAGEAIPERLVDGLRMAPSWAMPRPEHVEETEEGDPMADLLADVLGKPHGEA